MKNVISDEEARNMIETWRRGKGKATTDVWKQKPVTRVTSGRSHPQNLPKGKHHGSF